MPKRLVHISLAVKIRLLFSLALLAVIVAALGVPWFFMEVLTRQGLEGPTRELTWMRLQEWYRFHSSPKTKQRASNEDSMVSSYYREGKEMEITGPVFHVINRQDPEIGLDRISRKALRFFFQNPDRNIYTLETEDKQGGTVYRGFRIVRNTSKCSRCHNERNKHENLKFKPGQSVAIVEVSLPESAASRSMLLLTRGTIVVGGILAGILAIVIYSMISNRIILRPLRSLKDLADKVAEGSLDSRSEVRTGDELQRLGDSFNEMLDAIVDNHNRLRSANLALDQKLDELGEVNVALYEANQIKTEFLANITHELRTPLNSIIGFADLLRETDTERVARYGENIATAAKNLLAMINNMLDMARIEAGKAKVNNDKVSILDICKTMLVLMGPLANQRDIELLGELDEKIPVIVTDGGKIQQILFNLLSNAIKFTPPGGRVVLSAGVGKGNSGSDVDVVTLAVEDTGPGIAESDQAHIFEKFYRLDATLTSEFAGTGLGLAICKDLAGLLNGKIELNSQPGKGSIFSVTIPLVPDA